ncbi:MAG: dihydrodipicolinate synthase family protein [Thermoplasmata archaeon]
MHSALEPVVTLEGLIVPTPTLFGEHGELDEERNARFCRGLSERKVAHLFVLGSLGEFPSVDEEERARLLNAVAGSLTGGTDMWVGCGAPSTPQAIRFALQAERAGARALVAVPPYYLHPEEAAVGRYYRALRAATRLPILAYNIPSLVGYALRPELVHALGQEGVLAGVKDTSGSLPSVRAFLHGAPPGFVVVPGDDGLASDAIAAGASGAVMGTANVLPGLAVQLVSAARRGETAVARECQAVVDRLIGVLRAGPFPSTGKFLAARLRAAPEGYRSPYDPLGPTEQQAVLTALAPYEAEFLGRV